MKITGFLLAMGTFVFGALPAVAGPMEDAFEQAAKLDVDRSVRAADAKRAIHAALRDPASARFRNLREVRTPFGAAICGEVNSRNGFGGMTGFIEFVSAGDVVFVDEGRDIDRLLPQQMIWAYCGHGFKPADKTITQIGF